MRIELPDVTPVSSDAPDAEAVLSDFFGREVLLAQAAPDDYTIDQHHPDEPDYDPGGHRDEIEEVKLGAGFYMRDAGVLKTLARHNRHDVAGGGLFPCAGVYAVAESGGTVRAGDPVQLV